MSEQKKKLPPRHVAEFFQLINDAEEDQREALLKQYCGAIPFDLILSLNFNDKVELELPSGEPPDFKKNTEVHPDMMSPTKSQIVRLKACIKQNKIPKFKKEHVFIQVLEAIPLCDAEVLILAKDKQLETKYPNITKEMVSKVFPNYV